MAFIEIKNLTKKLKKEGIKKNKIKEISLVKAIKIIKKANGVPVLAHPWIKDETLKIKNMKKSQEMVLKIE